MSQRARLASTAVLAALLVAPTFASAQPATPPPPAEDPSSPREGATPQAAALRRDGPSPQEEPQPPAAAPSDGTTITTSGPVIVHVGPGPAPAPSVAPAPAVSPARASVGGGRASPPPDDDPATYEDPELDVAYPRRGHFMMRLGAGPAVYSFHGDRILMGGADMTLGADTKAGSFGANVSFGYGRTEPGLTAWRFDIGGDLAWTVGPVRLGVGPRIGALGIGRVTFDGSFGFVTAGLVGIASIDLVHTDGFNLSLAVRPSIEAVWEPLIFAPLGHENDGAIMGVSSLLEFRFRAPKGPPKPKREKPGR